MHEVVEADQLAGGRGTGAFDSMQIRTILMVLDHCHKAGTNADKTHMVSMQDAASACQAQVFGLSSRFGRPSSSALLVKWLGFGLECMSCCV